MRVHYSKEMHVCAHRSCKLKLIAQEIFSNFAQKAGENVHVLMRECQVKGELYRRIHAITEFDW